MIPVQVLAVHLEPSTGASVVLLGELTDPRRALPIFVGPFEAQAIVVGMQGLQLPRPSTHQLMLDVMAGLGAELREVHVTELREGTFLAELEIETQTGDVWVSARPSDGIALAVRVGATILVADEVLDDAGVPVVHEPDEPPSADEIDRIVTEFEQFLEAAEPADFKLGTEEEE